MMNAILWNMNQQSQESQCLISQLSNLSSVCRPEESDQLVPEEQERVAARPAHTQTHVPVRV